MKVQLLVKRLNNLDQTPIYKNYNSIVEARKAAIKMIGKKYTGIEMYTPYPSHKYLGTIVYTRSYGVNNAEGYQQIHSSKPTIFLNKDGTTKSKR